MDTLLELDSVTAGYRGRVVVRDVSLRVREGAFVCLLGPSGCGKTTLLRAIAGFEPLLGGHVRLAGTTVARPGDGIAPERRRVGMVFQEGALFPHLTVAGNIAFGVRGGARRAAAETVGELLEVVGLAGFGGRYVHELSGGQQQRVALARVLAPRPRLVLLDEPFSSLDTELRARLGHEVRTILEQRGTTAVLVTHDQNEAFALADQIGVMRDGALLQWDDAYQLYHQPNDRFVADFIGQGVFVPGRLVEPDAVATELGVIRGNRAYAWPLGHEVEVLLRPDDIQPDPHSATRATVVERAFQGASIRYVLRLATGSRVLSQFPSHQAHQPGDEIGIRVTAEHLIAFPRR